MSPRAATDQGGSIPILFCDRGCPFAHRVLALFEQTSLPFERREAVVGQKPDGIERYSARKHIPLLVHEGLVLTESRVMLEYLAERYRLPHAYPAALADRTLQRHAMAVVDDALVPLLMGRMPMPSDESHLADTLNALEAATRTTEPIANLLTIHVATIWRAFRTWHPNSTVTSAIEARASLANWLNAAAQISCVLQTSTDPTVLKRDLERARQAGHLTATAH